MQGTFVPLRSTNAHDAWRYTAHKVIITMPLHKKSLALKILMFAGKIWRE